MSISINSDVLSNYPFPPPHSSYLHFLWSIMTPVVETWLSSMFKTVHTLRDLIKHHHLIVICSFSFHFFNHHLVWFGDITLIFIIYGTIFHFLLCFVLRWLEWGKSYIKFLLCHFELRYIQNFFLMKQPLYKNSEWISNREVEYKFEAIHIHLQNQLSFIFHSVLVIAPQKKGALFLTTSTGEFLIKYYLILLLIICLKCQAVF